MYTGQSCTSAVAALMSDTAVLHIMLFMRLSQQSGLATPTQCNFTVVDSQTDCQSRAQPLFQLLMVSSLHTAEWHSIVVVSQAVSCGCS